MMTTLTYIQAAYLIFLGLWLGLAAFNNIVDRSTNRMLLRNMMSMKLIKEPPLMGQGMWNRAIDSQLAVNSLLWAIVVIQFLIVSMLLFAGLSIATHGLTSKTLDAAHIALGAFGALWAMFMAGGLWFGYWMKTWHLQLVHMLLIVFTLLGLLLLNTQPRAF
jgi:predicted small integral membrane protein